MVNVPAYTADGQPFKSFGSTETCRLDTCPIQFSIFEYRPSLAANTTFLALFVVGLLVHIVIGIRTKSPGVSVCISIGCALEAIGYIGRLLMWKNPFSYPGFIIQILFLTIAPVFYSAAVYVTVSQMIQHLDAKLSRVSPTLYYRVFITSDVVALILQAVGGVLSSLGEGDSGSKISDIGVDLALAGLAAQVASMGAISVIVADYLMRYFSNRRWSSASRVLRQFVVFESLAIILIFIRCAYRVAELSDGFSGDLYHDENLFIGLESVPIALAVFALAVSHPGWAFKNAEGDYRSVSETGEAMELVGNNNKAQ